MCLSKTGEEQDREAIEALSRRPGFRSEDGEELFLVTFTVNKILALVGDEEVELDGPVFGKVSIGRATP